MEQQQPPQHQQDFVDIPLEEKHQSSPPPALPRYQPNLIQVNTDPKPSPRFIQFVAVNVVCGLMIFTAAIGGFFYDNSYISVMNSLILLFLSIWYLAIHHDCSSPQSRPRQYFAFMFDPFGRSAFLLIVGLMAAGLGSVGIAAGVIVFLALVANSILLFLYPEEILSKPEPEIGPMNKPRESDGWEKTYDQKTNTFFMYNLRSGACRRIPLEG